MAILVLHYNFVRFTLSLFKLHHTWRQAPQLLAGASLVWLARRAIQQFFDYFTRVLGRDRK
jgi:hypothetical protein